MSREPKPGEVRAGIRRQIRAFNILAGIADDVKASNNPYVRQQLTIAEGHRRFADIPTAGGETLRHHLHSAAVAYLTALDHHNREVGGKILDASERLQVAGMVAR